MHDPEDMGEVIMLRVLRWGEFPSSSGGLTVITGSYGVRGEQRGRAGEGAVMMGTGMRVT